MTKYIPRGVRNNNPLNIRIGNSWKGEVAVNTDGQFEQFVSMDFGIRAAVLLLHKYQAKYRRNTISEIISAWAPSSENATNLYINIVSKRTGIDKDKRINLKNLPTLEKLLAAMIEVETGTKIGEFVTTDDITSGILLAYPGIAG
ncbi:MAG: structural protein [Bacteroidota bacterium]|nr:structural protein [Bacteroidota bacterium]